MPPVKSGQRRRAEEAGAANAASEKTRRRKAAKEAKRSKRQKAGGAASVVGPTRAVVARQAKGGHGVPAAPTGGKREKEREPSLFKISKLHIDPTTRLRRAAVGIVAAAVVAAAVVWSLGLHARNDFFLASSIAIPLLLIAYVVQSFAFELQSTRGAATRRSLVAVFVVVAAGEAGALYALAAGESNPASLGFAVGGLLAAALLIVAMLLLRRAGKGAPG